MANPLGALALVYLFSIVFTDELSLKLSPVDRLVSYQNNANFTELIPEALYNGTIIANWAIPQSALFGITSQSVAVKITASVPENSSLFFPSGASQPKETSVYLRCDVEAGRCASSSILSATIPIAASAKPDGSMEGIVTLRSEITGGVPSAYPALQQDAGAIFESLKNVFTQNATGAASVDSAASAQPSSAGNLSFGGMNFSLGAASNGSNFLDTLKPEGDSQDPLVFLQENPLISIFALIIVIVITGAYLLNAKD